MCITSKKIISFCAVLFVVVGVATRAATLTNFSVTLSDLTPSKTSVTQTIKFESISSIAAPGDVKIEFASEFNLTNVAASADITVSGGGVTWDAIQNSDLNNATNTLTLGWNAGTLNPSNQVTVTINFTKNPTTSGAYNVTVSLGPDGFATPTDSRTIPVRITSSGVAVSGSVPYPETNPSITNISPVETIIINSGATQVVTFDITDVNANDVDYTITPSAGTISATGTPATPLTSGTASGVTVSFTYFADGLTGSQTITVTADDHEATGGDVVTYTIQIFVI